MGSLDFLPNHHKFVIIYGTELAKNPKNARNHFNLGEAYLGLGMYDKAARSIEEAINLEPENKEYVKGLADVYYLEGLEFYNKKEYDAAERPLEESIKLDGKRAEAHCCLAKTLRGMKEYDKGIREADLAIKLKENYEDAYIIGADCYFKKADLTENKASKFQLYQNSRKYYSEALKLNPDSEEAERGEARALWQMNNFRDQ